MDPHADEPNARYSGIIDNVNSPGHINAYGTHLSLLTRDAFANENNPKTG